MRVRVVVFVAWLLIDAAFVAAAPPADPEFAAAKLAFTKEMKNPGPKARTAAVTALAKVPRAGSVDLLINRGLFDPELKVRLATRAGLRGMADDSTVSAHLINELKKSLKKSVANQLTLEVLRALVSSDVPERQEELLKFIDDFLATPKGNLLVPMTLIDEFAEQQEDDYSEQRDQDPARAVGLLAKAKVFEALFGYRRCIVQAMSRIRSAQAVSFLIELLPKTEGLIQADIVSYLTALTKQRFRTDVLAWAEWWEQNRETFEFPEGELDIDGVDLGNDQLNYYRIPLCAKRIVFVLDTSGSMGGPPYEAAKQALISAIESLPEMTKFNVVMFDHRVDAWQGKLVPASKKMKIQAEREILNRRLAGGTFSGGALKLAFMFEPEVIYFVSDGEPTDALPMAIVNAYSELNRMQRISIHAIGLNTGSGIGGLSLFMKPLAARNYGKFVLINE